MGRLSRSDTLMYPAAIQGDAMPLILSLTDSLERFRREPTPDAALAIHGQMLAFRERTQAADFRQEALEALPDNAPLRAGFAVQLDDVGIHSEATELHESALRLDPNLPSARVGVAVRRMNEGELDEARKLLAFLETSGAGRDAPMGLLDVLARRYQAEGRHEEALALAEVLLREVPDAAKKHEFRTFVRKSERALGRPDSILPPREGSFLRVFRSDSGYPPWVRRTAIWGTLFVLVAAALTISNEYIRGHRTLHVVNATGQPVQVRVDDGPTTTISPGIGRISLSEGKHRVKLGGAVDESHEIHVSTGYFRRWFGRPLWVLNPGGEAVLDEETLYYATHPRPSSHRVWVGEPFVAVRWVDYPFETPPDHLQVKSSSGELVKTAVEWVQGFDANAFMAIEATEPLKALSFAEHRLRRVPDQTPLMDYYIAKALSGSVKGGPERALAFLKSGLDRKPPSVRWHRAYQALMERDGREAELVALYDRSLAADPRSAAYLYLRGRIDPNWDKQDEYFARAIESDPNLRWPWMARGMRAASRADWGTSAQLLRKARDLGLIEPRVQVVEATARIAVGEADAVAREYHTRLTSQPPDADAALLLFDALVASGQADRIDAELGNWQGRLQGPDQAQLAPMIRALAYYQAGKLDECETLCRNNMQLRSSTLRAHALLAQGKAKEVLSDTSFEPALQGPWPALAVALALALDGDEAGASSWRERACKELDKLTPDYRRAAAILRADAPTSLADLNRVFLEPGEKALVLALLGTRFPDRRPEYFAAAAKFNVRYIPPHHLVRRAIEGAKPAAP
jgi:tetratricopeptide (TPR) repeat protein